MSKKQARTPDRFEVFEVTTPEGETRRLHVTEVKELMTELGELLPQLEKAALKGAALLAFHERATLETKQWSIRRIGAMVLQEDDNNFPANRGARTGRPKQASVRSEKSSQDPDALLQPAEPVQLTPEDSQAQAPLL
ncbi:hypothetical protein GCM10017783_21490 [Deinococcus piscis]|uniref:Uncharacterized protein n=1 Tax=Deinococcus piscis TaxID=394230 RepID=A0ABQ3K9V4_9DEIO|nr:hypothetical protein [Deinococcus piscis]GHG08632.1 hypothetical protein GCM10017783_21490 [Deinococcus piscis]